MTLSSDRRQVIQTLTTAGYPIRHIAACLGVTETIVQRHLDALEDQPQLPVTRVVDDGPVGAGHVPHDPDRVASLAAKAEHAVENQRTRRLNVEMGLTPRSTERQIAGFARYREQTKTIALGRSS